MIYGKIELKNKKNSREQTILKYLISLLDNVSKMINSIESIINTSFYKLLNIANDITFLINIVICKEFY